jgi:hypothetical protein
VQNVKATKKVDLVVDVVVWKKIEKACASKKMTPEQCAAFLLSKRFNQPHKKTA